jgi:branched-chain amino acid transport system substrate-binding protein
MSRRSIAGLPIWFVLASASAGPAMAADSIRIGVPLPLTGALADAGAKQDHGYEACRSAVEAKGGVKVGDKSLPLEFMKYDYQSDTKRAVQLTQRLIASDKADFLFSPYGSGDTKAAATVAERYGIPMIASGAAAESIFNQGLKNIFGILFPSGDISKAEIAYYKQHVPGLSKLAVLSMNSLYPSSIAENIRKEAKAAGMSIVFDASFSPDTLDFSEVISQIKASTPDWVYVTGYTQSNILLRREMVDQGLTGPIISMTLGPTYPEFAKNLGASSNGVTTATWWDAHLDYPDHFMFGSTKAYAQEYQKRYGVIPADVDAAATATCEVLVEAIEAAGSTDRDAVRKVLNEKQFDTFFGPIKFGSNGQNTASNPVLVQVENETPVILSPPDMKEAELKK